MSDGGGGGPPAADGRRQRAAALLHLLQQHRPAPAPASDGSHSPAGLGTEERPASPCSDSSLSSAPVLEAGPLSAAVFDFGEEWEEWAEEAEVEAKAGWQGDGASEMEEDRLSVDVVGPDLDADTDAESDTSADLPVVEPSPLEARILACLAPLFEAAAAAAAPSSPPPAEEAQAPAAVAEAAAPAPARRAVPPTMSGVWESGRVLCLVASTASPSTEYPEGHPTDTFLLALPKEPCAFLPLLGVGNREFLVWVEVGLCRDVYKGGLTLAHAETEAMGTLQFTDGWSRPCLLLDEVLVRTDNPEAGMAMEAVATLFQLARQIRENDPSTPAPVARPLPLPVLPPPAIPRPAVPRLPALPPYHAFVASHLLPPGAGTFTKRLPPPKVIPRALVQFFCGTCRNDYAHSEVHPELGKKVARWCPMARPNPTAVPHCCPRCGVVLRWVAGPAADPARDGPAPAGKRPGSPATTEGEAKKQRTSPTLNGGTPPEAAPNPDGNGVAAAAESPPVPTGGPEDGAGRDGGAAPRSPGAGGLGEAWADALAAVAEKVNERETDRAAPHEAPGRLVRSSEVGGPDKPLRNGLWKAEAASGGPYTLLSSTVGCEVLWLVGTCPCKQGHICRLVQLQSTLVMLSACTLAATPAIWEHDLGATGEAPPSPLQWQLLPSPPATLPTLLWRRTLQPLPPAALCLSTFLRMTCT